MIINKLKDILLKEANRKRLFKKVKENLKNSNLIKSKPRKSKTGRIYVYDKALIEAKLPIGLKVNYVFDKKTGLVAITPSKDSDSSLDTVTISRKASGKNVNPLIDIRKGEITEFLKDFSNFEIEIYNETILLRGFSEEKKDSLDSLKTLLETIPCDDVKSSKNGKVLSLKKKATVKREIIFKKKDIEKHYLKMVSGGGNSSFEQLSFEAFLNAEATPASNYSNVGGNKPRFNVVSPLKTEEDLAFAVKMASLCCGAGVLDKGFIDSGFKATFALDIEPDMVKTYVANLGNHAVVGDLSAFDISTIKSEGVKVLTVGTPCQDLSNANRVTGKILDTPKNLLIRKVIDTVKHLKDLDVFIIENVPQLLTKGKKFVDEIKERLSDFEITVNKVNSADFGSAQSRERAIIIGSKIGKIELKAPSVRLYKTVRQAFEGITEDTPNQQDYSKSGELVQERMAYVKPGGNFKDIPEELRGKGVHSNSYRRLEWDKPSITIANPRKSCLMPPVGNRILSVRECAALFDLPHTFEFFGSLANKQQMIANAVPLALSKAIAAAVKKAFLNFYGDKCKFEDTLALSTI